MFAFDLDAVVPDQSEIDDLLENGEVDLISDCTKEERAEVQKVVQGPKTKEANTE